MDQDEDLIPVMASVRDIDAAEWPEAAARFQDLGFEQTLAYARPAAARIGGRARFLVVEAGGAPVAAAAVRLRTLPVLGRGIAWIPSGPLVVPRDGDPPGPEALTGILAALRRRLAEEEGHVLRLRLSGVAGLDPALVRDAAAAAGFAPTLRAPAYRSFAMDLSQDSDTLMQRLNGKWRTDLRFALKSGLSLERGMSPEIIARFMAMFDTVQTAKGFRPDIPPAFHFALHGARSPDYRLDTLIAQKDGSDLAGIVIGTAGTTTTYLFGATAEAGRPLRAGYFLQWEAMALSRSRGVRWYDLGGIDFDANPDVSRFKERMGGCAIAADPYEVAAGPAGRAILKLEGLRARLKGKS